MSLEAFINISIKNCWEIKKVFLLITEEKINFSLG